MSSHRPSNQSSNQSSSQSSNKPTLSRAGKVLSILALTFAAIQIVPYGRAHDNPPVVKEPAWDTPQTRQFAKRACFDCHSNETVWPWYSQVAPVSWLVQSHVEEARGLLNFSRFDQHQKKADDAFDEVEEGEMPMFGYALLHAQADFTEAEHALFLTGLKATLGTD